MQSSPRLSLLEDGAGSDFFFFFCLVEVCNITEVLVCLLARVLTFFFFLFNVTEVLVCLVCERKRGCSGVNSRFSVVYFSEMFQFRFCRKGGISCKLASSVVWSEVKSSVSNEYATEIIFLGENNTIDMRS